MVPPVAISSKEIPCNLLSTAAEVVGAYLKNAQLRLGCGAYCRLGDGHSRIFRRPYHSNEKRCSDSFSPMDLAKIARALRLESLGRTIEIELRMIHPSFPTRPLMSNNLTEQFGKIHRWLIADKFLDLR